MNPVLMLGRKGSRELMFAEFQLCGKGRTLRIDYRIRARVCEDCYRDKCARLDSGLLNLLTFMGVKSACCSSMNLMTGSRRTYFATYPGHVSLPALQI